MMIGLRISLSRAPRILLEELLRSEPGFQELEQATVSGLTTSRGKPSL